MLDVITAIVASAFAVAMVTTMLLPGRQTPAVLTSGGGALAAVIKASIGQG